MNLAPNGKPSNLNEVQYHLVRTKEFKAWFGDWENSPETASKVVDSNGEPLVVYHGTLQKFNVFNTYFDNGTWHGKGAYFTSSLKDLKTNYVTTKDDIYLECFLDIKNPIIVGKKYEGTYFEKKDREIILQKLRNYRFPRVNYAYENSYDSDTLEKIVREEFNESKSGELLNSIYRELNFSGIIFLSPHKLKGHTAPLKTKHFVAFKPNQIKLADGTNTTFDSNNTDIRYAGGGEILTAPNGKPSNLTPEQYRLVRTPEFKAWFGDWENESSCQPYVYSQLEVKPKNMLLDENGEPQVFYHGSYNYGFTVVKVHDSSEQGLFWLSTSKEFARNFTGYKRFGYKDAQEYYDKDGTEFLTGIYSFFIKTNKIFDIFNYNQVEEVNRKLGELVGTKYIHTYEGTNRGGMPYKREVEYESKFDKSYYYNLDINGWGEVEGWENNMWIIGMLKELGYDCITNKEGGVLNIGFIGNPNQIKLADEMKDELGKINEKTNTTFDSNNPDIRYAGGGSLTDVNVSYANDQQVNELYDLVSKSNELGNVGHPRLVLIQNNKVIGGIFVDNDYLPYEYMFDIFIKNSKRGKGYSKLLLDAMIKDFVENFPEADQIRGWVINKKLEDYLESKYDFGCADDNEEQILYCYLSKKDAEKLLNNKEFKKGGSLSKTPAPNRERIYGSKVNKPKSSESKIKASSIVLSPKVIASINTILEKHNEKSKKKISLSTAKAVVRRGMGAYSSTHRPTISGGKPNSRVAWGLARLNAFVYKIQNGHSKSGRYTQDDDLINELGFKVNKYADGGSVILAPNGKPSNLTPEQYRLVRTPAFKKWFGDWENSPETASKVVDENGEPLVVYHGTTNKNINIFRPLSYFTENYSYAKVYGLGLQYSDEMDDEEYDEIINRGEENVYSVFLNIVNPLKADRDFFTDNFEGSTKVKISKIDGYDGMINTIPKTYSPFYKENENQFLIFNSNQIKLADGTNTNFDSNNPDMRYELGGEITLTTEQVENKLARKLHWWNDDVVTINGIEYQKVFLRNEYKIK